MSKKQEKLIDMVLNHERANTISVTTKNQEIFYGIKRRQYPRWIGWKFIDKNRFPNGNIDITDDIETTVRRFYINEFYVPLRINEIANIELSAHLLDFAVQSNTKTAVHAICDMLNEMTDGTVQKKGYMDDELFDAIMSSNQEELTELLIAHRNLYCKDQFPNKKECKNCKKRVIKTTRCTQPSIFVKVIKLAHEKGWLQTIFSWIVKLVKASRTHSDDVQYEEG